MPARAAAAAADLHDADIVVMVMLIVRWQAPLESRDGLLEVFALVRVLTLDVGVHTRWYRVLIQYIATQYDNALQQQAS